MRRTILNVVLFLLLLGIGGTTVAMPRNGNDYEGCDGKCEQQRTKEAASLHCLAETVYYEAGNQPTNGKVAVAFVVINRAKKAKSTICDVVMKPKQFHWVTQTTLRKKSKEQKQWEECQRLAKDMLDHLEKYPDPTSGATAFRRPVDAPFPHSWKLLATIGGHIFYSQP